MGAVTLNLSIKLLRPGEWTCWGTPQPRWFLPRANSLTEPISAPLAFVPQYPISRERRRKRRFCIRLAATYKLARNKDLSGGGTILDISSVGVHFTTATTLIVGTRVILAVSWPARLNKTIPLKLILSGTVVRSSAAEAAATIEQYQFRTQSHTPNANPAI